MKWVSPWRKMHMKENPDANAILNNIGALAEIAGFMRDQLVTRGFSREEAVAIVDHYICATCAGQKS